MKEQKSYQNKRQEDTNFIMKSFRFLKNISPLNLFANNSKEQELTKEEEQFWKKRILQSWNVVDKLQNSSQSSEAEEQKDNNQKGYQKQEDEESNQDSDEDDIQSLKMKYQKLKEDYKKSENERKKLKEQNNLMRRQLQEWLKSPIKIRKYARIQGELCFDEECDQVKVEKSRFLELEEEEDD